MSFYPIELLSHRRKGQFAPCWLAAMTSEKVFKKYYNAAAIKKINVVETCDEIMRAQFCGNASDRFSLYLSAQLMYGITKIHSYQVTYFEKEMFEMERQCESVGLLEDKKNKSDAIEYSEFFEMEMPSSSRILPKLRTDLHTLPDEDLDNLQITTHDAACIDFGALNEEELDYILEHDTMSDFMKKGYRWCEDLEISKENDITEKMAEITITEERLEKQLSLGTYSPVLVDVSKRSKSKERLSLTPQKRQPQQIQVETPTKRRRLSFEAAEMPIPSAENVAISAPVEEAKELVVPEQRKTDIELRPLDSGSFIITKHSKKGKLIDQKIALTDNQLKNWRRNVNTRCTLQKLDLPLTNYLSRNLFEQPSHLPMPWNAGLRNNFNKYLIKPSTSADITSAELRAPEIMRVEETITRLNLPTEDLSTFARTDTAIATEAADSIMNILPMTNIVHEGVDVPTVIPLPEVIQSSDTVTLKEGTTRPDQEKSHISIDESFEDIEILLERQRHSETRHDVLASSPSSTRSTQPVQRKDILAMLEVLWCDQEVVKFSELISEETYTRKDAAAAFQILLDLYAEKKLVLQQVDFTHTLRIFKYKD